jgi:NAD(P)-dependent dehydrogenase (short-subunit alcohol dehydrogenase family)
VSWVAAATSMTADGDLSSLSSFPENGNAIVVGASGGIGSALSDGIRRSGRFVRVLEFGRASRPAIDLQDETSITFAVRHASALGEIRLVIDATGFLHDDTQMPEKTWRAIKPTHMARAFAVNAIGPALLMKHFLPLLPRSGKSLFATLSAKVGSIGDNRLGGWYSYRASKAALNQLVRTASIELKRSRPDAVCVALHPGTVDTPLSQPFRRTGLHVRSPTTAAQHLLVVMDGLGTDQSGQFFDYQGRPVSW